MLSLLTQLERLDRGATVPRLSGAYGAFFHRYAERRLDVVRLALEANLPVRRDGAVSGVAIGALTIDPLVPDEGSEPVETEYGQCVVRSFACPELLSTVTLRLWLSGAGAREAYRELLMDPHSSLNVFGDFRWLPPSVITIGSSECRSADRPSDSAWAEHAFMKAVGDDIHVVPHPLDYIPLARSNLSVLAHIRVFAGRRVGPNLLEIPAILRERPATIELKNPPALPEAPSMICLGYKEPGEQTWTLLRALALTATEAYRHFRIWVAYREAFLGSLGPNADIDEACLRGALALSAGAATPSSVSVELPVGHPVLASFVVGLTRLLRYE